MHLNIVSYEFGEQKKILLNLFFFLWEYRGKKCYKFFSGLHLHVSLKISTGVPLPCHLYLCKRCAHAPGRLVGLEDWLYQTSFTYNGQSWWGEWKFLRTRVLFREKNKSLNLPRRPASSALSSSMELKL